MYISAKIEKVIYKDCEAFSDMTPQVEAMFDYCDTLVKEKKVYDLDYLISELEDVGDTRAKTWELSCINTYANSSDCYMELMITFENDFYISLEPRYCVEGRC
jgi:hypothetical protein